MLALSEAEASPFLANIPLILTEKNFILISVQFSSTLYRENFARNAGAYGTIAYTQKNTISLAILYREFS